MGYSRLPFEQYFIDTSQDTNKTGKVRNVVKYKSVIFDAKHHAEYAVVLDKERNCVQVHFEKTNGDEDWNDNFNFPKQLYDTFEWEGKEIKLYVHTGWGNMYHALKHDMHVDFEEVMNEHPDAHVESIGWSLGSGEAQLGVQDLNYKYHIKPYLYTYGSVNPFWYAPNDKVTAAYLQSTFEAGYNFCHKSDIVTYQPPFPCYHMLNRVNVGKFHPVGLFDPWKYHTMYDNADLYKEIT